MERYWCLRWLAQESAKQVDAVVLKDEVLRLADIPLIIRLPGMPQVARGIHVKLDLIRWDEIDLSIEARLLEIVDASSTDAADDSVEESDEEVVAPAEIVNDPVAETAINDSPASVEPVPE
jgi:exoribonuclease II